MKFPNVKMIMPGWRKPQQPSRLSDDSAHIFYSHSHFNHLLRVERKRTERSKTPFLLLLLDFSVFLGENDSPEILGRIQTALASSLRETDIRGWYEHNRVIGIIFTEMACLNEDTIDGIYHKIHSRLAERLDPAWLEAMKASFYVYPETNGKPPSTGTFSIDLYPDMTTQSGISRQFSLFMKNVIDFVGSAVALILFSPIFAAAALAIKATSRGPVFFRQKRMGINGKTFMVLKFRSMYIQNDQSKHREYIEKYIKEQQNSAVQPGVFKLQNDSRITPVGNFLRKTSLDELPQFINVLKGEMSLVGPRPPIPYEYDMYDIWHRRRLLACKPGITGLWQVTGRSRTTFDEMARLDLQYINEWSFWLDLKIIFMTPKVMIMGKGGY